MDNREYNSWAVFEDDLPSIYATGVDDHYWGKRDPIRNEIRDRPLRYGFHSAIANLMQLSFIYYINPGHTCPFSIPSEIERLKADSVKVFNIDLYQESDQAKILLQLLLETSIHDEVIVGLSLLKLRNIKVLARARRDDQPQESTILPQATQLNEAFLKNLEGAIKQIEQRKRNNPSERAEVRAGFGQLKSFYEANEDKFKKFHEQDAVSFLRRETQAMCSYYRSLFDQLSDVEKKQPDSLLNQKNELFNKLNAILDDRNGQTAEEKLQAFKKMVNQNAALFTQHRDSRLMRFSKICLFTLAVIGAVSTIGLLGFVIKPLYLKLFKPRSEKYVESINNRCHDTFTQAFSSRSK